MSYCTSRFRTVRRRTLEVKVGSVGVGGDNPIRIQSMTTSDTQDVAATVRQSIALAEVGCEIVRITAPNVAAAKCLQDIRVQFSAAGFGHIPLVADIHFLPSAAMEAVEHVEKIRVNPGNYADKKKFTVREYSESEYDSELQRLHDAFSPLVKRCKELGRAMRIGTNHGSLSDRIMNRYGDTPLGMVESALEFLRIAESHDYRQIILSMKASNPKVMIQAYRLLVERMAQENMHYPLHLGVTEAGDGEDGRIKGAIGIGSLLLDGLGDTIRVSLTEDSVYEIPVARAIAEKAMALWKPETGDRKSEADGIDPFHYTRRETTTLTLAENVTVGPEQPPRVVVRTQIAALANPQSAIGNPKLKDTPPEGLLIAIASPSELAALCEAVAGPSFRPSFFVLELGPTLTPQVVQPFLAMSPARVVITRRFAPHDTDALRAWAALVREHGHFLACDVTPEAVAQLAPVLCELGDDRLLFTFSAGLAGAAPSTPMLNGGNGAPPARADAAAGDSGVRSPVSGFSSAVSGFPIGHAIGAYRALADALRAIGSRAPVWIRNTAATAVRGDNSFLSKLLEASFLTGSLLCDGLGDLVSIETEADFTRATQLTYNVLQGAGARISKTEFVACPSCGRTLFDLQTTTQRIREKTGHLKGVKLAIMGCIVNGPGEMADADFGYVGGAPGKINLYVGKTCVQYNIPQAEADARLIALIKEHGKWIDPAPTAVSA